jgi:glycosyltransferase involved in cell wall biosynthesis
VQEERVDAEKILVLPNGVDTEEFRPRAPRADLRRDLGIPDGAPVVAVVASLFSFKGHEVFLRAAARVLKSHPNARFLVIGEGPERANLEQRVQEMHIDGAVRFLGRRRDVTELLTLVDVSVLSSQWEAAPISALEAMACEVPVVCTRVGALPEMVLDGETGFLVGVGDDAGLAAGIARLLGDPALRRKMGQASRRRVVELYNLSTLTRRREALYRELVEAKAGH